MTRVTSPLESTRLRPSLMSLKKLGEYMRMLEGREGEGRMEGHGKRREGVEGVGRRKEERMRE